MIFNIIYILLVIVFLSYVLSSILISTFVKQELITRQNKSFYYYFLIPCVNEEKVIKKTLLHLCSSPFLGKIIPINDGSIDNTAKEIKKVFDDRIHIITRESPEAQTGKGEALNYAMQWVLEDCMKNGHDSDQVLIAVLDADGKLSTNWQENVENVFQDKNISAAQLRVKMVTPFKNTLQTVQDVEFFSVNNRVQKSRQIFSCVGLGGNGQFFRMNPIMNNLSHYPWGNALLDDYEFTIKMMMKGLKIAYIDQAYVYQEALSSYTRFIRQRSRWVQGNLDCLSYVKKLFQNKILSFSQKLSIIYFLLQPFINLVADLLILYLTFQFISTKEYQNIGYLTFVFLFIISILWGIIYTIDYLLELKKSKETKPMKRQILLLPFGISYIYIVLFFSIIIAFYRKIVRNNTWIKTKRN